MKSKVPATLLVVSSAFVLAGGVALGSGYTMLGGSLLMIGSSISGWLAGCKHMVMFINEEGLLNEKAKRYPKLYKSEK
ncbi:hypothetical protein CHOTACABRAS_242 [Bacillus phage Chotacabras]|nr:hypothetical protein CHOTACABRAS_242 [Bacillus phage Chotacabras]